MYLASVPSHLIFMLRENSELLTILHKTLDVFLVVLSFVAAYYLKRSFFITGLRGLLTEPNYYVVLLVIVLTALFFLRITGCYLPYRNQSFFQVEIRVIKAVLGILIGTIVILYLLHENNVSRLLLLLFSGILAVTLLLTKGTVYYLLRRYRRKNYNTRNVLIVGTGGRAKRMVAAIERRQGYGYRIIGCIEAFDQTVAENAMLTEKVKVLGTMKLLPLLLLDEVVDEVVFAADLSHIPSINSYIQFAEELGISIHIMPDFQLEKIMYQPAAAAVFMEEFAGMPTIAISTTPQRHTELLVKSIIDYVGAGCGLLLLAPLLLLLMAAVKLTSPGPAFFVQQRCGLYGRTFGLIKFRTMVENAEALKQALEQHNEMDGPVFKMTKDPRITPLGRLLRRTSLDELPQLFNVLKGEMSLVGPRPPLPSEVGQYEHWQRRRLSMKPGLTCIWQVSGRNNIDFERWMRMDLEYIDNWSLLLDVKLLLKTVKEVVWGKGR